jgi:hypothetical protein
MKNEQSVRIMCPNLMCQRILAVPTTARGKLVRCRGCGANIRIPLPKTIEAPAAPAPAEAPKNPAPKSNAA